MSESSKGSEQKHMWYHIEVIIDGRKLQHYGWTGKKEKQFVIAVYQSVANRFKEIHEGTCNSVTLGTITKLPEAFRKTDAITLHKRMLEAAEPATDSEDLEPAPSSQPGDAGPYQDDLDW